jgi:hypothetical protein
MKHFQGPNQINARSEAFNDCQKRTGRGLNFRLPARGEREGRKGMVSKPVFEKLKILF